MALKPVYISNLRRTLGKLHQGVQTETEAQSVGEVDMDTTTAPAAEPKQTVAQKVDALQSEKTALTSKMNTMSDGPEKTGVQESIAVIDRKLRWYAGRSEGKSKPAAAARPSKPAKVKAPKPGSKATASTEPVPPSANES